MENKKITAQSEPSIASGAIWSLLTNFFSLSITFFIFLILARLLSPTFYGVLSAAMLVVLFFQMVFFDSVATAIVRMKSPTDDDYNAAFWLCNFIAIPGVVIVWLLADYFERLMGISGLARVVQGTCIIIITTGLSRTHEAWLTHHLLFKALAIRSVISITLGGITGIYFAWKGMGVTALVLQQVVTNISAMIMLWILIPWKPSFSAPLSSLKTLFAYAKHVAISGLANFINQNSDVAFISYYLGSTSAGIYFAGKRIVNTLNSVLSFALSRVSLPAFSRLKDQLPELRSRFLNAVFFTLSATAPAFIGLSYLAHDVTYLLLGIKWIDSVPVMEIVCFAGLISSIGYYNNSVMFVRDRPDWQARLFIAYAVSNVLVFFLFVRYGVVAVAAAFTLREILLYPISAWCAVTLLQCRWKAYLLQLTNPLFGAGVMCAFLWGLDSLVALPTGWLKLCIDVVVGAFVYIGYMLFFTRKEKLSIFFELAGQIKTRK